MPVPQFRLETRHAHSEGVWQFPSSRFKVQTINGTSERLSHLVLESAKSCVEQSEFGKQNESGFVLIHYGNEAIWLLMEGWQQDILHGEVWASGFESEPQFERRNDTIVGCIWELPVIARECQAWVSAADSNGRIDINRYLQNQYQGPIQPGVSLPI